MATTTATISINSTDLTPGMATNISASSTLMKTGLTIAFTVFRQFSIFHGSTLEERLEPIEITGQNTGKASMTLNKKTQKKIICFLTRNGLMFLMLKLNS